MPVRSGLTTSHSQPHSSAPSSRRSTGRYRKALLAVNAVGAAAAGGFAAIGLVRPDYAHSDSTSNSLTEFWVASSAVRTWTITAPLLAGIIRGGPPAPQLLTAAGLVQLEDSALGAWQGNARMALFPAVMGLVHLNSARLLSPDDRLC